MKILLLAPQPFFQNRGTPIAQRELLGVLSERGYELDLLTYHEGEDVDIPNCRILRIPAPPGVRNIRPGFSLKKVVCDVLFMARCLSLVRRNRYDVVHAFEEAVFMAIGLQRLFGLPFVYDMDSCMPQQLVDHLGVLRPLRPALDRFERAAVRQSSGVVAVSHDLEAIARRHAPAQRVHRVEDVSLIAGPGRAAERLRETLGIQGPLAMYVGNLEAYQGVDLLIRGFARALDRAPHAHLVIVGGVADDIRTYRRLADRLGAKDPVHFLGPRPVSLLGSLLRQADVLVSPRVAGATPMKIYSYLHAGRPLLATRLPMHTSVLDDDIAHLASPTPEALGAGLVRLFGDGSLRRALGRNGHARVERHYSRAAFSRKVNVFYDEIEDVLRERSAADRSAASAESAG